ncbi:hypothetical protein H8356DRAFT_1349564 [Neocallimastix lanati (nom. inval.)]|nr:hypothetical protein H8356DRAFT_1349564 [Neocallimastix sp. JGI-2020a]
MVKRNEANVDESVENERNVVNESLFLAFANLASLRIYEHVFDHVERSKPYVVQLASYIVQYQLKQLCLYVFLINIDAKWHTNTIYQHSGTYIYERHRVLMLKLC